MKLFSTKQIAELDKFTIENEPISDINLMERAALQISGWLVKHFTAERKLVFFAGPGNNGGDALAIARQMADLDFVCEVYLLDLAKELKGSPAINWKRLEEQGKVKIVKLNNINGFPEIKENDVIIDGLFGSGLTRPLEGLAAEVVQKINNFKTSHSPTPVRVITETANEESHQQNQSREIKVKILSIDIPSGLMGEDNSKNILENVIRADYTLTFQFPKISFLFAENEKYIGEFDVLPIGLHPEGITKVPSDFYMLEAEDILNLIPKRSRFSHKGTFGHALLIAGTFGKMGAAVLASKACLRSGVGLLTTHIPHLGYPIIQTAVPEAMASIDQHDYTFTEFPDLKPFTAVGVGPGIDKKSNTKKALCELLEKCQIPIVIDADGLNILSENKDWLEKLPEGSVLTPHPGEFKRLVGESASSYENIQKQIEFSKKYKVVVVLKGAFTSISNPHGKLYFNSTGNSGMATAGSGDVLTGIILGLLAQGLSSESAAVAGVFIHGLAGDLAAKKKSKISLVAVDIIDFLGKAFLTLSSGSK